jgi:hypothetical protein
MMHIRGLDSRRARTSSANLCAPAALLGPPHVNALRGFFNPAQAISPLGASRGTSGCRAQLAAQLFI